MIENHGGPNGAVENWCTEHFSCKKKKLNKSARDEDIIQKRKI